MKELLSFSHVATDSRNNPSLCDFNLVVFAGEIITLIGLYGSGISCVKQILYDATPITQGRLSVTGRSYTRVGEAVLKKEHIAYIDSTSMLVQSLSVAENLFLLRNKAGLIYNRHAAVIETAHILKQYRMDCQPEDKVYQLSIYQQCCLSIIKAMTMRAKLIVLDLCGITLPAAEQGLLADLILSLRKQEVGFLILENRPDYLSEIANRTVLVEQGRDIKLFFEKENVQRQPFTYVSSLMQTSPSFEESVAVQRNTYTLQILKDAEEKYFSRSGELIGIYDPSYFSSHRFSKQYLQQLFTQNDLDLVKDGIKQSADAFVGIPKFSERLLHHNLSISENLILPHYKRLHRPFAVVNTDIQQYCLNQFFSEIMHSPPARDMGVLSNLYQRILSVYRWTMFKPAMLFLDDPAVGLDMPGERLMFNFLYQRSQNGSVILLASDKSEILKKYCSIVIQSRDAKLDDF